MKLGTKSVLYGAHAFWLHPWFVALAWWRLYGFPWDPRLWVAFLVHDLGYWGRANMDDELGELHPFPAARLMGRLFDGARPAAIWRRGSETAPVGRWADLVLFHSRFLSRHFGVRPSRLCMADKLAVALEPWWLYLPRVIATGEVTEYMALARDPDGKYGRESRRGPAAEGRREWCTRMQGYCRAWAFEHRDGRRDTWTPAAPPPADDTGADHA